MYRAYTWLLPPVMAIILACAGGTEQTPPEPARGSWLTFTFDPSLAITPQEIGSPVQNMEVLGEGKLPGGASVEVRTWKPPFQDAPEDDPFGQSAEEAEQAAGAYLRACRDGTVEHLARKAEDPEAGPFEELAVRGMMWDANEYAVMFHHLWTWRTAQDLCAVAWVGTAGQEVFFGPQLRVMVGRADERFVLIAHQVLDDSPVFAPLEGKSLREKFAGAGPLAETVWDSPEVAEVRKLVDTLAQR